MLTNDLITSLDIFDPFDVVDQKLNRRMQWLDQPDTMHLQPQVPHRYRITLDCQGFKLKSLQTELKEVKGRPVLKVVGLEERGNRGSDNYMKKELKRSFTLPKNVVTSKMVSFMTPDGKLVIELPLRSERTRSTSPVKRTRSESPMMILLPRVLDTGRGKEVMVVFPIPEDIPQEKIHMSVKDRDLILRVEDTNMTNESMTSIHIFDRATLPETTEWNMLKCMRDGPNLVVSAPLLDWNIENPDSDIKVMMQANLKMSAPKWMPEKDKKSTDEKMTKTTKKKERSKSRSLSRDVLPRRMRDDPMEPVERRRSTTPVSITQKKKKERSIVSSRSRDIMPDEEPVIEPTIRKKKDIEPTISKKKDVHPNWYTKDTKEHDQDGIMPPMVNEKKKKKKSKKQTHGIVSPFHKDFDTMPTMHGVRQLPIEITKKGKKEDVLPELNISPIKHKTNI